MNLAQARALMGAGRLDEAEGVLRGLIAAQGSVPDAFELLGACLGGQGRHAEALEQIDRALELRPVPGAGVLFNRARALLALGRSGEAREALERVVGLKPDFAAAWRVLAQLDHEAGRLEQAIAGYRRALALEPRIAAMHNNLANALRLNGAVAEAYGHYAQAVQLAPDLAEALTNYGTALREDGRASEALPLLERSAALQPQSGAALINLGLVHYALYRFAEAESCFRKALEIAPTLDDKHVNLARAEMFMHQGRIGQSRDQFRAVAARFPSSLRAALGAHLLLPRVYESLEHLESSRAGYAHGLEELEGAIPKFTFSSAAEALSESRWVNFHLAYQGRNDRVLQESYGGLLRRVLEPHVPDLLEPRRPRPHRERIRVGLMSHFFFNCVVGRYFAAWVTDLDPRSFEVIVYYSNTTMAEDTKRIAASAGVFRHVAGQSLEAIARQVIADDLDVLVYPELGMHAETFVLAALRLAPVQCVAWGHPTTTGMPEIDWFLSAAQMEPENAEAHYSEKLALLPGLGTRYAKPTADSAGERADFGIPEGRTAYLVPQSLFKIHPENDALLARVLERDPAGVAVMFASAQEPITRAFVQRLGKGLAERVVCLRFAPHAAYLRINELCDVMLDTLHWSGGNTTLDALASALPVVTLPGSLMRGRQSAAMLRQVGVPELVARDIDDYVEIAHRLGRSREDRQALRERIVSGREALFDQPEPVRAFEEFLRRVAP